MNLFIKIEHLNNYIHNYIRNNGIKDKDSERLFVFRFHRRIVVKKENTSRIAKTRTVYK